MKLKFKNDAYTGWLGDGIRYLIFPNGAGYSGLVDDGDGFNLEGGDFDTNEQAMAYCADHHRRWERLVRNWKILQPMSVEQLEKEYERLLPLKYKGFNEERLGVVLDILATKDPVKWRPFAKQAALERGEEQDKNESNNTD